MVLSTGLKGRQTGLTLIEMMVTLVVLAIVLSIAIPSFTKQIQAGRAEMAADGLKRTIASARALAAQTGKRTSVKINGAVTGCGDSAVWAVTQGSTLISCLSTTDFAQRYEGAVLDSTVEVDLVFGPSGLSTGLSNASGSLASVTYRFVSGSQGKAVKIDAGGAVELSDV